MNTVQIDRWMYSRNRRKEEEEIGMHDLAPPVFSMVIFFFLHSILMWYGPFPRLELTFPIVIISLPSIESIE